MANTHTLNVSLSEEAAEFIRSKMASGEFSSESEVINESLMTLKQEAEDLIRWEQEVVGPTHDRLMADPSSAISFDKVMQGLEAKRLERLQTK